MKKEQKIDQRVIASCMTSGGSFRDDKIIAAIERAKKREYKRALLQAIKEVEGFAAQMDNEIDSMSRMNKLYQSIGKPAMPIDAKAKYEAAISLAIRLRKILEGT